MLHQILDFWDRECTRLVELVSRPLDFELDITCRDGVGIQRSTALPTRMRELSDEQGAVLFGQFGHFGECLHPVVVVVGKNWIAKRLDGVVLQHQVAGHDDANLAFAPTLVEAFVLFGWEASRADVFAIFVPVASTSVSMDQ